MLGKLGRIVKNPWKYGRLVLRVAQEPLCYLFRNAAFRMQGQMDIHPKSRWYNPDFVAATGGFLPANRGVEREICDLEPWDSTRRDMVVLLLRSIIEHDVSGDFVEVGVYRGRSARLIHHYAPERRLHLFDTFGGFGKRAAAEEREATGLVVREAHHADTCIDSVRRCISPKTDNVFFYEGYFPDTIPDSFQEMGFAFVHLDADLYEPTLAGLRFFFPRVSVGGMILVHDYNAWPGARKATDAFLQDKPEVPIPMPDKSGSALIVKQRQ
jgi:O-methyltransferase